MRAALIVVALALVAIATDAALTRRKRQALPVNSPTAVGASSGSSSGLSPNELEEIIDNLIFGLDAASGVPPAAGGVRRKRQALPTDLPSLSPEDVTSLPLVEELEDAVTGVIGLVEGEQEFDESVFTTAA